MVTFLYEAGNIQCATLPIPDPVGATARAVQNHRRVVSRDAENLHRLDGGWVRARPVLDFHMAGGYRMDTKLM